MIWLNNLSAQNETTVYEGHKLKLKYWNHERAYKQNIFDLLFKRRTFLCSEYPYINVDLSTT